MHPKFLSTVMVLEIVSIEDQVMPPSFPQGLIVNFAAYNYNDVIEKVTKPVYERNGIPYVFQKDSAPSHKV